MRYLFLLLLAGPVHAAEYSVIVGLDEFTTEQEITSNTGYFIEGRRTQNGIWVSLSYAQASVGQGDVFVEQPKTTLQTDTIRVMGPWVGYNLPVFEDAEILGGIGIVISAGVGYQWSDIGKYSDWAPAIRVGGGVLMTDRLTGRVEFVEFLNSNNGFSALLFSIGLSF